MAISKSKNPPSHDDDIDALKSDVASFASSIGLSSALSPDSGFNDSDFRKKGLINPQSPPPQLHGRRDSAGKNNKKPPPPPPRRQQQQQQQQQQKKGKGSGFGVFEGGGGMSFQPKYKHLPKLPLMRANDLPGQWYSDLAGLEGRVLAEGGKSVGASDLEVVKQLATEKRDLSERLLEQFSQDYDGSRAKSGDMKMVAAAQRSGTAADKVAAFTCLVEDNPIANLRSLDALLGMVTSKVGKRHALTGFEALRDLFMLRLLPDRKLKTLVQRPINHLPETKDGYSLLLLWYWEEILKLRYERFVGALEEASRDMLPVLKDKALKTIYALLRSKSEQERRLLSMLVNKLGDPERKAASGAGYYLQCLLSAHPNMKAVVIEEVDSFLFRPHLDMRAKYHAINFLSQIFLNKKGDGPKIAKRLVDVYFALFKVLMTEPAHGNKLDKKGKEVKKNGIKNNKDVASGEADVEMDSRLLSALLTGVNRAFPYIGTDETDDLIEVETPILFKLVHSKNFNVGVQALMLLYQISLKNQIASDRFYRALYSKLLVPAVLNSSKPEMFLGLLFKAMKNDLNMRRLSSFSKRLLQVAIQQPPQYACGCLFILSEVLRTKPPLWSTMLQMESIDEEFEHFEDIIEDSVVPNSTISKPENLVSRIYNVENYVEMDSGSIASESAKSNEQKSRFEEGKNSEDDNFIKGDVALVNSKTVYDNEVCQPQTHQLDLSLPGGYDPRHREPSYCNADRTSWWELTILASHVHPSVSTMARTLLCGANITYNGDPLKDLSLNAFLDKFMEKKPKPNRRAEGTWHGGSQIAPAKKIDGVGHLIGAELLSLDVEDIPPEDLVFHTFYVNKMNSAKKSKKKKKKLAGDEAAEELFGVDDSDESDIDEIEGVLDSTGNDEIEDDYDYDDLDEVVDDDGEDLLGSGSDAGAGPLDKSLDDVSMGSDDDNVFPEDGNEVVYSKQDGKKKNKRKLAGRSGESPFASLEEYEHLLKDAPAEKVSKREKSGPHRKKKRRKSAN